MTREEMIRAYKRTQAAAAYIIGFVLNNRIYRIILTDLFDEMFYYTRESMSHGGLPKLKLRLTNAIRVQLIEMGAVEVGGMEILNNGLKNKGDAWEKWNTEQAGQTWHKDTTPYYLDGDLTVNEVKYQIKFEGASFTNEKVIRDGLACRLGIV